MSDSSESSIPTADPATEPHTEAVAGSATSPAPPVVLPEPRPTSLPTRVLRDLGSMSVRYKIAGTIVLMLGLTVLSLGIVTFTHQNAMLRHEMRSRAATLAEELANVGKEGLLTGEDLPVVSTIGDIAKREDVVYAMIVNNNGQVFAHSDFSRKGSLLTGSPDLAAARANTLFFQEITLPGDSVLEAAAPIVLKTNGMKVGVARVGLSQKTLKASLSAQKRIYLWVAAGFIAASFLVSFALARLMTKPLESLAEGIQVVARGDLRRLVAVRSDDEIGKVTNVFNQMILSLREKLLMEKYLSQSTVLNIKEHRDVTQLKLGGERKYVTAVFSDARGFTALAERMSPEDVVSLMNIYLNLQTSVVHKWGGIVDKFVGDEVMAIFEGHGMEPNAVRAAVEIQSYCKALNAARAAQGETQVNIGIGINSGDVVMGNMGSEDHMDYTVIGDSINVAARLCGVAQPGQVLVSRTTADAVGSTGVWNDLPPVTVKGKNQPIGIVEAVSIKGGARRYMRKDTNITVTYTLEGFSDEPNTAEMRNISPAGCLLEVSGPVGIGSKLRVRLSLVDVGEITVPATVYHARKKEHTYFVGLCFENLEEEIRFRIVRWIHQVNSSMTGGLFL
jgi:adenylate cyclase